MTEIAAAHHKETINTTVSVCVKDTQVYAVTEISIKAFRHHYQIIKGPEKKKTAQLTSVPANRVEDARHQTSMQPT